MRRRRLAVPLALAGVLALSIVFTGCGGPRLVVYACRSPSGVPSMCVGVRITKAVLAEPLNVSTMYETREVDPNVYAPDSSQGAWATVTLTLRSGATMSHSQALYYDDSTYVAPVTPGNRVLVYRPVDPAAAQSLIDHYRSQTADYSVTTDIPLQDISDGSVDSSRVDAQGHYNSTTGYLGSAFTRPPRRDREPPPR
jgi:hypothetical protein